MKLEEKPIRHFSDEIWQQFRTFLLIFYTLLSFYLFYECYFTEIVFLVDFFFFNFYPFIFRDIITLKQLYNTYLISKFTFSSFSFVPDFYFCFLISEKCSSSLWRMQKQLNTMPRQTNYFQQKNWVSQSFFQKCFLLFMTFQKSSVFVSGIYSYFWKFLKENNLQMKSFS